MSSDLEQKIIEILKRQLVEARLRLDELTKQNEILRKENEYLKSLPRSTHWYMP